MFIIAEEKTQPHAADSGIQAGVVSTWLAPTFGIKLDARDPDKSWTTYRNSGSVHSCTSGQKGPRDQICIYRPYAAKPK